MSLPLFVPRRLTYWGLSPNNLKDTLSGEQLSKIDYLDEFFDKNLPRLLERIMESYLADEAQPASKAEVSETTIKLFQEHFSKRLLEFTDHPSQRFSTELILTF